MLGAIAGDIIGSIYEWDRIKTKSFQLFGEGVTFTDDSVCTVAVADCILQGATSGVTSKRTGAAIPGAVTAACSSVGWIPRASIPTAASATARPCG